MDSICSYPQPSLKQNSALDVSLKTDPQCDNRRSNFLKILLEGRERGLTSHITKQKLLEFLTGYFGSLQNPLLAPSPLAFAFPKQPLKPCLLPQVLQIFSDAILHSFGGYKSKIKMPAGLLSLCVLTRPFLRKNSGGPVDGGCCTAGRPPQSFCVPVAWRLERGCYPEPGRDTQ